ncbi:hypothetical protein OG782_23670 [Streptomyces sp. NBC_00876]|uniref:hypothetical protein n=1 Tax=Streptomyces sp. NBC_00876 TaxID=2975853 RepID=UPI003867555A|nr:hypothetical protein OG782_23670 [Streptomyces sp. NBC_00876]
MVTEIPGLSASDAAAPGTLPGLASTLRADAARMEEYARTLRATAATLDGLDEAPPWCGPVLEQQASACLVAADQLRTAAAAADTHVRATGATAATG